MKFYSGVLALCVLQGTTAFVPHAPKALIPKGALYSSYLGDLGGDSSTQGVNVDSRDPVTSGPVSPSSNLTPAGESAGAAADMKNIWETSSPITVQGGSLRTWSFATPAIERVLVLLKTDGRPLHSNVDLWQGPDNTPQKMGIYIEDGNKRPFSAVIETPRAQNSIAIRNTGQMEFPLSACVEADVEDVGDSAAGLGAVTKRLAEMGSSEVVQGGAVRTWPFDPLVASVQVLLRTDGRPLNARIELLQGPNNNKQVINLYTEDGNERPFFAVFETPGSGNVVRIVNTATVEFPLNACVEPYMMERGDSGGTFIGGRHEGSAVSTSTDFFAPY